MHLKVFKHGRDAICRDFSSAEGVNTAAQGASTSVNWNPAPSSISPNTAQLVSGVGKAVATGVSGMSAVRTAQSKANAANFNGQVDLQNADLVAKETSLNETNTRIAQGQQLAKQGASLAQSGFAGGGSQTAVQTQSSIDTNLAALQTRFQGNVARTGLLNDANQQFYTAQVEKNNAKSATFNAVGTGLAGLMEAGGRYVNGQTPTKNPQTSTPAAATPASPYFGTSPENLALLKSTAYQSPFKTTSDGYYSPTKNMAKGFF